MDQSAAHDLMQPNINRALETRRPLRWIYYLSLGTLWFLRRQAFAKVYVNSTGLSVDHSSGVTEIPFHQLVGFDSFHIPLVGGWMTLTLRDGTRHRFTSFLERADYILDAMAMAQPTLVAPAKLESFRRSTILADHVMARMESSFANWRMLVIMQILLPLSLTAGVVVALNATNLVAAVAVFASLGIVNAFVTGVVWACTQSWEIMRKNKELVENPLNPLRDLRHEQNSLTLARIAHLALVSALTWWMWV